MRHLAVFLLLFWSASSFPLWAQSTPRTAEEIRAMIRNYKKDPRGPFKDIRWFCPDGSTRAARDPCPEKNGVQHARYKDEVVALGRSNQIHLVQILAGSDQATFWGRGRNLAPIKQYQLSRFLVEADNGWILRRAKFYRGAIQEEDESSWGIGFYTWLLRDTTVIRNHYFLLRQSARDVPHAADDQVAQRIRAASKSIADTFPSFMDLRVKIHGQPDRTDLDRTRVFYSKNKSRMIPYVTGLFDQLIADLEIRYRPLSLADLSKFTSRLPKEFVIRKTFEDFLVKFPQETSSRGQSLLLADLLMDLRTQMAADMSAKSRLACLDLSLKLEVAFSQSISAWVPASLPERFEKVRCLVQVATATGFLELWEWEEISPVLQVDSTPVISLERFRQFSCQAQAAVEWGAGMVRATYGEVIRRFSEFEPLSNGFSDDVVRSSVLLPLGEAVSDLARRYGEEAGLSNDVMGISGADRFRGLNPGYAMGELVVVDDQADEVEVAVDKIYIFHHPPADLKPVAGIATVTEGNLVSHVQLLARNLGIPNAVLSAQDLHDLKAFQGRIVFYAVSTSGLVILKPKEMMTAEELELIVRKERSEEKIRVPVDRMDLGIRSVVDLRTTRAMHSGIWCGPKAANLGELKHFFPEHVVDGLVLPFGLFRAHMDQPMPGRTETYWSFLTGIFNRAENLRKGGATEADIEQMILGDLAILRREIKAMPFLPGVREEIRRQFEQVLGGPMGAVPVFVRSDTNMEDLKDFTGAGLNLTLFNVLEEEKIMQGIRDVWASPYSERSYRWRQRYLLDPENVYPSILIIPSVNADRSGVMITKGVTTGRDDQVTVAFSRGVGGAVEGQSAESWLILDQDDTRLLAPARETTYTNIPPSGGAEKLETSLSSPLLSAHDLASLRAMAARMRDALPIQGPLDIELGFREDRIWLFQVRPFVENKKAAASSYLLSISPEPDLTREIPFDVTPDDHE